MRNLFKSRGTGAGPEVPLPEPTVPTTRLIHIGPHKTGTTTVQSAFHHNREALAEHGIHYVGPKLQPANAVKAMTGVGAPAATLDRDRAAWRDLAAKARTSGLPHIVISSEFLCEASDEVATQLVSDLGGPEDTRVVITLRPLAKMIPSQWQQFVQSSTTMALEDWTEAVLEHAAEPATVGLFWGRHRHDELVRRWARIVGAENVTVIVCDSRDHDQLTREFARLLELPPGLLVPVSQTENRSLTWEEAEAIRAFNIEFASVNTRRHAEQKRRLALNVDQRLGAWRYVKRRTPQAGEHRIPLPASAVERVTALANEMVDNIMASGAVIVGDVAELREVPTADAASAVSAPETVPVGVAAAVAAGLLTQVGRRTPAEDGAS